MKTKRPVVLGGVVAAISGIAVVAMFFFNDEGAVAKSGDPRQKAPVVTLAAAIPADGRQRRFTGVIAARVQSDLGFRVAGKVTERLVDVGDKVDAGQPIMRIDDSDLRLALVAKQNAVEAARAVVNQLEPDERRYAKLLDSGWIARQRYEQVTAALNTARAQLAAAAADAKVAENETTYAVLMADADGTVIETLGEPGQVVSAGQTVIRIARTGPREAVVALPEKVRPSIGSLAEASVYGDNGKIYEARLRQLSDAADPMTRTYEARYVLDGAVASEPLGATVTISLTMDADEAAVEVPLGAILDDGSKTGVWMIDAANSTVHFQPVKVVGLSSESAVISGLNPGVPIVSLGAHLLNEGAEVRITDDGGSNL